MRQWVLVVAMGVGLVAASAVGAEDEEIISVKFEDLPKIWRQVGGNAQGELSFPARYRAGCTRFSMIVESNGRVSTFKVLGTFPDTEFGDVTRRYVESWRFEATKLNPERIPAYTDHTIVWVAPGGDRILGSNRREKISSTDVANQCMLDSMKRAE